MNLHHDALVLVADSQKYLLLGNNGDFCNPALKVEASAERSGAPTSDVAAISRAGLFPVPLIRTA